MACRMHAFLQLFAEISHFRLLPPLAISLCMLFSSQHAALSKCAFASAGFMSQKSVRWGLFA